MAHHTADKNLTLARARAEIYGLLACVWHRPDQMLVAALGDDERWQGVRAGALLLGEDLAAHLDEVSARWCALTAGATLAQMQCIHDRLFGHCVRGACPPYELEYGRRDIVQQAPELADINGFYMAFGIQQRDHSCERPDHVAVECEFLSVLAAKEAFAWNQDDLDSVEILRDAQRAFLEDHLGRWLPSFARRTAEADPDGFYGSVATLASMFIDAECVGFGVAAGPCLLELAPADPATDAGLSCGAQDTSPDVEPPLVQIGSGGTMSE